jgi:hypothetical protein
MELLIKVAGNLERHAKAMERLADQLEGAAPEDGTHARRHWDEEDIDGRIVSLRHEAKLARRAIKRIESALADQEKADASSRRAA